MNYITEQILSTEITTFGAIFKLLLSLCLGALIGTERRHKGQAAGMRTFALIAMGATLAMIISIYIPQEYMGLKNGDPGRIAAQVISGIGFLGAGAIIQMKGSVRGLTSWYLDDSMFGPRHWCRNVYHIYLFLSLHHRSTQIIRIL